MFENSFFLHCIKEWSKLNNQIRNIESITKFKVTLNFIRSKENSAFDINYANGVELLSRLKLNFSQLNEPKFQHNFNDTVYPICISGFEPETTLYYLSCCNLYSTHLKSSILNPSLKNYS